VCSLPTLVALSSMIGGAGSLAFGSGSQIVSRFPSSCGGALALGIVSSGPIIIFLQYALSIGPHPSELQQKAFFLISSLFPLMSLCCSLWIVHRYWAPLQNGQIIVPMTGFFRVPHTSSMEDMKPTRSVTVHVAIPNSPSESPGTSQASHASKSSAPLTLPAAADAQQSVGPSMFDTAAAEDPHNACPPPDAAEDAHDADASSGALDPSKQPTAEMEFLPQMSYNFGPTSHQVPIPPMGSVHNMDTHNVATPLLMSYPVPSTCLSHSNSSLSRAAETPRLATDSWMAKSVDVPEWISKWLAPAGNEASTGYSSNRTPRAPVIGYYDRKGPEVFGHMVPGPPASVQTSWQTPSVIAPPSQVAHSLAGLPLSTFDNVSVYIFLNFLLVVLTRGIVVRSQLSIPLEMLLPDTCCQKA
jgi:hypothetical protein